MKIIIRYCPGGSGTFVGSLIYSLFNPEYVMNLRKDGSAHDNLHVLYGTHNYHAYYSNQESVNQLGAYTNYSLPESMHQEVIDWFQNTLRFDDND